MYSDAGGRPEVKAIHRQCIPEYGRGDEKRTTTDSWQTECVYGSMALCPCR